MNITCPNCKVSGDIDDSLIGPEETVIACTKCGHYFKIFNDKQPDEIKERGWMIRKKNGALFRVNRLSNIQKWILGGTITLEDEFSKSGKTWMKLGDVTELAGLFQLVQLKKEDQTQKMYQMDTINLSTVEMPTKTVTAGDKDEEETLEMKKSRDEAAIENEETSVLPKDLTNIVKKGRKISITEDDD